MLGLREIGSKPPAPDLYPQYDRHLETSIVAESQAFFAYTKLTDSPNKDAGAVRIKVEKVDDGQLQLTTFKGNLKYQKGKRYVVTGWCG